MVLELISYCVVGVTSGLSLDPVLVDLTLFKFLSRELSQRVYECEREIKKTDFSLINLKWKKDYGDMWLRPPDVDDFPVT